LRDRSEELHATEFAFVRARIGEAIVENDFHRARSPPRYGRARRRSNSRRPQPRLARRSLDRARARPSAFVGLRLVKGGLAPAQLIDDAKRGHVHQPALEGAAGRVTVGLLAATCSAGCRRSGCMISRRALFHYNLKVELHRVRLASGLEFTL